MSFDQNQFQRYLTAANAITEIYIYDVVTSTNTLLLEKLDSGAPIGTIVIAAQQTAGRGQWGRTWVSSPGGLYLSMAIAPNLPASQSARLTLASAWGIATRLRHHQVPVQLKWPNDLYLHGKKLGGILTETAIQKSEIHQAVVGVGINWINETPDHAIALTHSSTVMHPPISSLEELAALVVNGIDDGQRSLQTSGLTDILPDYQQWLYQSLPDDVSWENL